MGRSFEFVLSWHVKFRCTLRELDKVFIPSHKTLDAFFPQITLIILVFKCMIDSEDLITTQTRKSNEKNVSIGMLIKWNDIFRQNKILVSSFSMFLFPSEIPLSLS